MQGICHHNSWALPVHSAESARASVPEHLLQGLVLHHLCFIPVCTSASPTQSLIPAGPHSLVPAFLQYPLADSLVPHACPSGPPGSYPMSDQLLVYRSSRPCHPIQYLQWPHVKGELFISVGRPLFIIPKLFRKVPEVSVFACQTAHGGRGKCPLCVLITLVQQRCHFLHPIVWRVTSATEYF